MTRPNSPVDADVLALTALVERYAALVDDRDFEALGALFTEDAVLRQPRPPRRMAPDDEVHGRAAIVANFGRVGRLLATQHAVVGKAFTATDAGAEGRIAAIAHHVSADGDRLIDHAWHLTYLDRYRRDGADWLIAERTLRLEWIEQRTVTAVRER